MVPLSIGRMRIDHIETLLVALTRSDYFVIQRLWTKMVGGGTTSVADALDPSLLTVKADLGLGQCSSHGENAGEVSTIPGHMSGYAKDECMLQSNSFRFWIARTART